MPLNDLKLRVRVIDQLEADFLWRKNIAISSVANTIKKFHIQSDLHFIYKKNFYNDKQKEIDEVLINTIFPY